MSLVGSSGSGSNISYGTPGDPGYVYTQPDEDNEGLNIDDQWFAGSPGSLNHDSFEFQQVPSQSPVTASNINPDAPLVPNVAAKPCQFSSAESEIEAVVPSLGEQVSEIDSDGAAVVPASILNPSERA